MNVWEWKAHPNLYVITLPYKAKVTIIAHCLFRTLFFCTNLHAEQQNNCSLITLVFQVVARSVQARQIDQPFIIVTNDSQLGRQFCNKGHEEESCSGNRFELLPFLLKEKRMGAISEFREKNLDECSVIIFDQLKLFRLIDLVPVPLYVCLSVRVSPL